MSAHSLTNAINAVLRESPNLDRLARTGDCVPLTEVHLVRLAQVATIAEGEAIDSGELATVTAGVITTVDRCAGSWNITARSNGHDSWLAISERSYGRVVAERDTDLDDVTAVAISIYVLWGWATIGPNVF
jgi:hypothetical protein